MAVNEPAPVYAPQPASDTPQKKKKNVQPNQTANFDWSKFLEAVHAKSTGAYSYLTKSGYELDDQQLTIFTGKKFAKNQIEKRPSREPRGPEWRRSWTVADRKRVV